MRTSGDCVWEKQHIWNIPDGLKKVIAGVVTVSLLVGIGDAVSMVPLQEDMRSYAATAGETIRWSVPIRLGQMVKQESIRTYTLAEMEKHVQIETENIQNIENGAFSELGELTWIEAGGTGEYTARDGILFSGTELAAFPAGRTGIFEMPKDVTSIRASAFANTNLDKIDMRNCISILCDEGIFGDGAGCEIMEGKNGI